MNSNLQSRRTWAAGAVCFLIVILLIHVVSCQNSPALRQGWNPKYGPVVPHDKFPADCSTCHAGENWTTIRADFTFDHTAKTGFELRGAHRDASCLRCHNDCGAVSAFSSRGCGGCHEDPHRSRLGPACETCHQERSWNPTGVAAMHNRTRFPLLGAHAATACFECHAGAETGNFSGNDTACVTCHRTDLARTTAPNHLAQGWVSDCQTCHTPQGWDSAHFKHTALFPLTGGHAGLSCTDCHHAEVFLPRSTECVSCHFEDFQNTQEPNHVLLGFSTDCAECHTPTTWRSATLERRRAR